MTTSGTRVAGLAWCAGTALIAPLTAQGAHHVTEQPAFAIDQWTTRHGLPQNSVTALAQTPDGYLWIGTFGGLVRFDGTTFTLVERRDSAGRHVDRVLSLAVGRDSALWIGTEDGLVRRYHDTYRVYTASDGLPDNEVDVLYASRTGTLWVGSPRGGLARLADGQFESRAQVAGTPVGPVFSIVPDSAGTLWISAGERLLTVTAESLATARWRAPPASGALRLLLQDRAGALWFSRPDGVLRLDGGGSRVYGGRDGVPGRPMMIEDPGGGYWLGTANDGLFFFQPDGEDRRARHYALPGGRAAYRIRSALVDRDGHVWFGTNANGLLRAQRNLFTTYTAAQGLSHDVTTAVYVDTRGTLWAGTNCYGVNAVDWHARSLVTWKPRKPNDPTGDPCVFALTEGPPGTIWVGTWGGGLTRIAGGRVERLAHAGLADSVVLALFTDRDGAVWVGTSAGGVARLQHGRVAAAYTTAEGLAHNSVRTIYQTRDGALWIGTLAGLSRLANGHLTTYTAADGLSAAHVRALYEDRDGNLWIGTYGGGLDRLRDDRFHAITQRDGLPDDVVSSILEDGAGRLWMSGNRGIYRVARTELLAFTEGRVPRVHGVLYGESDGLQNAETNGGFQPAAAKDTRGRLWFPTVRGVAVVDPAAAVVSESPPPVRVEEVVVDGAARAPEGGLVVASGRPNLEFRYAALSLSGPQHVTFRYRLDGFDQDWVEVGPRRVAYYPRLGPGQYRFVVAAANREGIWSETAGTLRLRVVGPLWSTWWFKLGGGVVLLALAGALLRRRAAAAQQWRTAREEFARRLIESQEHERRRIAGELHDGLGQELLVVKNRALLALRLDGLQPAAREQLRQIDEVVTHSLSNVRGLAHNLTPYQLEHLGLSTALRAMIETAAEATDIAFTVTVEDVDGLLPVESQINLYRIVQEAVANVVRHSGARTAAVHVRRADSVIVVTIKDDGRGFELQRDRAGRLALGFGLSGIAERVRILGGHVEVVSAPGRGTRIELYAPVARVGRTA